jgi:cyanophycin synthetase
MTTFTKDDLMSVGVSTRLIANEALDDGYELEVFRGSSNINILRAKKDNKEIVFTSASYPTDSIYGHYASDDKFLTYNLLKDAGISTPETVLVKENDEGLGEGRILLKRKSKVVVKPAQMDCGKGITIDIQTINELDHAIDYARQRIASDNKGVLVQEMVHGDEYRLLVVDGKTAAITGRRPPFIMGNGKDSVASLIEIENTKPERNEGAGGGLIAKLKHISLNDVERLNTPRFLKYIPALNEKIQVLKTSNLSRGGYSEDFTHVASRKLKELAEAAARATFLSTAGVDIITDDISGDTGSVIETNLFPGIRMHMEPFIGDSVNVAKIIWESIKKTTKNVA